MHPQSHKVAEHQLSDSTQFEYVKICARLTNDGRELHEAARSKSYAGTIRSAFRYALDIIRAPRPEGLPAPYYKLFEDCIRLRGGAEKVESDLTRIDRTDLAKRKGRVRHLAILPRDWFSTFIAASREESHLERGAILVLALSGCRPDEVAGISIRPKDGKYLMLAIPTAKEGPGRRPIRFLIFRANEVTKEILDVIGQGQGDPVRPFRGMKTDRIRYLIKKVSDRAFGKGNQVVNASDLRNNFASMLKHAKWPQEKIAEALGHSATGTQKAYGRYYRASKAAGYVPPALVQGAQPVRSNSTLERFLNPPDVPAPPRERN